MIKVAFIDDGINMIGAANNIKLEHNIEINDSLEIIQRSSIHKMNSHATVCANIFLYYSIDAVISSVKILDDSKESNPEKLVKAIEWCIENNIKLVNISLGSIYFKDSGILLDIVNRAYKKKLILVASNSNKDVRSFPAFYSNVIGVRCNKNLIDSQYIFNPSPEYGVDFDVSGELEIYNKNKGVQGAKKSNSCSAPYITALIANVLLQSNRTLSELKNYIAFKNSITNYNSNLMCTTDWIESVTIINIHLDGFNEDNRILESYVRFKVEITYDFELNTENLSAFYVYLRDKKILTDTLIIYINSKENYFDIDKLNDVIDRKVMNVILFDFSHDTKNIRGRTLNIRSSLKSSYNINQVVDVPVVLYLTSFSSCAIKVAKELSLKFLSNDYNAVPMSNIIDSQIYDIVYFDDYLSFSNGHAFLSEKMLCDIVIVSIDINQKIYSLDHIINNADIVLYDKNEVLSRRKLLREFRSHKMFMDADIDVVFSSILDFLS